MASRLRKVRHLRGSRTMGWGQITQHRRTGQKGKYGNGGSSQTQVELHGKVHAGSL